MYLFTLSEFDTSIIKTIMCARARLCMCLCGVIINIFAELPVYFWKECVQKCLFCMQVFNIQGSIGQCLFNGDDYSVCHSIIIRLMWVLISVTASLVTPPGSPNAVASVRGYCHSCHNYLMEFPSSPRSIQTIR